MRSSVYEVSRVRSPLTFGVDVGGTRLALAPNTDDWHVVEGPVRGERFLSMLFLLWLIAVVLVVAGIVALIRGAVLYGIVLIVVGLLVGPGGVSVFT
jgi:hypothetical protein